MYERDTLVLLRKLTYEVSAKGNREGNLRNEGLISLQTITFVFAYNTSFEDYNWFFAQQRLDALRLWLNLGAGTRNFFSNIG